MEQHVKEFVEGCAVNYVDYIKNDNGVYSTSHLARIEYRKKLNDEEYALFEEIVERIFREGS